MKYSFITTVRNRAKYLSRCLDSILWQDLDDYEILVVDYGSTVPVSVPERVKLLRLEAETWNCPIALNTGIANAGGEYTIVVDCDVLLAPSLLSDVNHYLTQGAGRDGQVQIYWARFDLTEKATQALLDGESTVLDYFRHHPRSDLGAQHDLCTFGSFLTVRREILLDLGGYDECMSGYGHYDTDLERRLTINGTRAWWGMSSKLLHQYHEPRPGWAESFHRNSEIGHAALVAGELIRNGGRGNFEKYRNRHSCP